MWRDARLEAGLSREEAAFRLHIGGRTLYDYETGKTLVPPDIALRMAEVYKQPTITARYCEESCPIGQVYAHPVTVRSLCGAVLGVLNKHNQVTVLRDTLVAIAEDGVIDDVEKADFEVILEELLELEKQIETLKLYAATVVNLPQIIKRVKEKDRAKAAM